MQRSTACTLSPGSNDTPRNKDEQERSDDLVEGGRG
jgi:hypothetical protein